MVPIGLLLKERTEGAYSFLSPFKPNGISHYYISDQSIFVLSDAGFY